MPTPKRASCGPPQLSSSPSPHLHPRLQLQRALLRQLLRLLRPLCRALSVRPLLRQLLPLLRRRRGLHTQGGGSKDDRVSHRVMAPVPAAGFLSHDTGTVNTQWCNPSLHNGCVRFSSHLLQHLGRILIALRQRGQQPLVLGLQNRCGRQGSRPRRGSR